jgi:hypothetical protein
LGRAADRDHLVLDHSPVLDRLDLVRAGAQPQLAHPRPGDDDLVAAVLDGYSHFRIVGLDHERAVRRADA